MTSTEARGSSATREFALALASGGLYGATNTVVGHPFDTIKTRMQAGTQYRRVFPEGSLLHRC